MSVDRISDEAAKAAVHGWFDDWDVKECHIARMRRAIAAALPLLEGGRVAEGWKLVPIEPHGQMARAARLQYEDDDDEGVVDWFAVVAAAIAAAPESKP